MVTIDAKSDLPANDYLKNKFIQNSDSRRIYRFDSESELLESVQVYLAGPSGDVLIFDLQHIDYNEGINPAVFQLALPADVSWSQLEMQKLPDNAKYAAMTAPQAARAFFDAFAGQDWTEAGKFMRGSIPEPLKTELGGLELVKLGEAFTSAGGAAQFVPYEIKLKDGSVRKHNLALKKDRRTDRWFVDGGF